MTAAALPLASVIVPVLDGEETVGACVDSLLALDYPPDRLDPVFVDNGSTDATPAVLASYGDRLRVVRQPRRGRSAARNAGLAAARGDVVAFTDADCVVDRGWLRGLVEALGERDDLVVGGPILAGGSRNAVERFGERIHDHHEAIEVERPPYVITMNCATRLATLRRHASFDESLRRCEDVDISYRLYRAGCSFSFVPRAVVRHRNERTLGGLFVEGVRHGFYGVQAASRHRPLVHAFGHRTGWRGVARRWARLLGAARSRDRGGPELAFLSGKALGGTAGSVRFRGRSP
jgi:glycosyltransferase involved in cell wall biosynthesis